MKTMPPGTTSPTAEPPVPVPQADGQPTDAPSAAAADGNKGNAKAQKWTPDEQYAAALSGYEVSVGKGKTSVADLALGAHNKFREKVEWVVSEKEWEGSSVTPQQAIDRRSDERYVGAVWKQFNKVKSEVHNEINPEVAIRIKAGKPPSGVQWDDIIKEVFAAYYHLPATLQEEEAEEGAPQAPSRVDDGSLENLPKAGRGSGGWSAPTPMVHRFRAGLQSRGECSSRHTQPQRP